MHPGRKTRFNDADLSHASEFARQWASCVEPQLTTYAAKVNGHNIHLLIPVVKGKPKYNKADP